VTRRFAVCGDFNRFCLSRNLSGELAGACKFCQVTEQWKWMSREVFPSVDGRRVMIDRAEWLDTGDRGLGKLQSMPGGLLPILHAIQEEMGYIPPESVPRIAEALNLSRAEVHGVISFYHDFRTEPAGRHVVHVCRAESCQSVGAEALFAHACRHL